MLELEREAFRVTHQEAGGYLVSWWKLPFPIVETALYHHFVIPALFYLPFDFSLTAKCSCRRSETGNHPAPPAHDDGPYQFEDRHEPLDGLTIRLANRLACSAFSSFMNSA